jgi:hypothetical protein
MVATQRIQRQPDPRPQDCRRHRRRPRLPAQHRRRDRRCRARTTSSEIPPVPGLRHPGSQAARRQHGDTMTSHGPAPVAASQPARPQLRPAAPGHHRAQPGLQRRAAAMGRRVSGTSPGSSPSSRRSCWTGLPPGSKTSTPAFTGILGGDQLSYGTGGPARPTASQQPSKPNSAHEPNSSSTSGRSRT